MTHPFFNLSRSCKATVKLSKVMTIGTSDNESGNEARVFLIRPGDGADGTGEVVRIIVSKFGEIEHSGIKFDIYGRPRPLLLCIELSRNCIIT